MRGIDTITLTLMFMNISELKAHIGRQLQPGDWFVIEQERINDFADVTQDHQFIHVDPQLAGNSAFGSTVAHGFLTLSLLTRLAGTVMPKPDNCVTHINYGVDGLRFLNPVRPGDRVRVSAAIADVEERASNRVIVKLAVTVEIEGQAKPALACEWLNLFVCEPQVEVA